MRRRQSLWSTSDFVNVKFGDAPHPFQHFEAFKGDLAGSCNELQKLRLLFFRECPQNLPEPDNILGADGAVDVVCIFAQIFYIDRGQT